jgi:hypothetical protein
MTDAQRNQIDSLSQYQLAKLWRFAKVGEQLLQDEAGQYFVKVFQEKGGMTPEISKSLGW